MSEEKEKCPKCDKEPITHRRFAGEKNWICGNGHNWTTPQREAHDASKRKSEPPQIKWKLAPGILIH